MREVWVRTERWWAERGYTERVMPLPHMGVVLANAVATITALTMLSSMIDQGLHTLPVSITSLFTLSAAKSTVCTGAFYGAHLLAKHRRRALGGTGKPVKWRLWLIEAAKVGAITACYAAMVVALRFLGLVLLAEHFAGGDLSALTLTLPATVAATVFIRAALYDRSCRQQKRREFETRADVTALDREIYQHQEAIAARRQTKQYVALVILLASTLMIYYPATLDVPAFAVEPLMSFGVGIPVLLFAGAVVATGDTLLEAISSHTLRTKRRFAFQVSLTFLVWNALTFVAIDHWMGNGFFDGYTRTDTLPPGWLPFLGAQSAWRAHVWYLCLTMALASAVLMHIVCIVLTGTAVPLLFSTAISMMVTFLVMMLRQTPAVPNLPAVVYFACGATLIACAIYVYTWTEEQQVTDVVAQREKKLRVATAKPAAPPAPPATQPPPADFTTSTLDDIPLTVAERRRIVQLNEESRRGLSERLAARLRTARASVDAAASRVITAFERVGQSSSSEDEQRPSISDDPDFAPTDSDSEGMHWRRRSRPAPVQQSWPSTTNRFMGVLNHFRD